jgi:zinc D-Ala-D-Ala carboxypeptidase
VIDADDLDLVEIAPGKYLARKAAEAFERMKLAAFGDGLTLIVNTAWRSRAYQESLRRRYEVQLAAWEKNGKKGPRPPPAAKPGKSKHELGLAVDLNRAHDNGVTDAWLAANAGRYGFKRTVASEPWHWEWLGAS